MKEKTFIKTETGLHYVFQEINTNTTELTKTNMELGSDGRGGEWLGYMHVAVQAPVQLPRLSPR
jgi:hypothetical protein